MQTSKLTLVAALSLATFLSLSPVAYAQSQPEPGSEAVDTGACAEDDAACGNEDSTEGEAPEAAESAATPTPDAGASAAGVEATDEQSGICEEDDPACGNQDSTEGAAVEPTDPAPVGAAETTPTVDGTVDDGTGPDAACADDDDAACGEDDSQGSSPSDSGTQ